MNEKDLEEIGIEYLQCPYCGAKLERISTKPRERDLVPTSCDRCQHHNFEPNYKKIVFLDDIKQRFKQVS